MWDWRAPDLELRLLAIAGGRVLMCLFHYWAAAGPRLSVQKKRQQVDLRRSVQALKAIASLSATGRFSPSTDVASQLERDVVRF